jgi:hypothetical protein
MDLGTVENKLRKKSYRTIYDFAADMRLIFRCVPIDRLQYPHKGSLSSLCWNLSLLGSCELELKSLCVLSDVGTR